MPPLTVSAVLSDAGDVYRLLFRRSFPIALGVYAVIGGVEVAAGRTNDDGARVAAGVLAFILSFAGPLLVQGGAHFAEMPAHGRGRVAQQPGQDAERARHGRNALRQHGRPSRGVVILAP